MLPADARARPTLIFLHYFGGSARAWSGVIARLAGAFDCLALDLRGFGAACDAAGPYSVDAYADDVASLLARRGSARTIIVGHSMGGKIALALAARRPLGISGLVLVAPSPPTPEPMTEDERARMLGAHGDREALLAIAREITARPLPPVLLEQVVGDMLSSGVAAWSAWLRGGSRESIPIEAGPLSLPSVIITGGSDTVIPRRVLEEDVMPRLATSRLIALAGAGHLLPLEAPDRLADLIGDSARIFAAADVGGAAATQL